MNAKSPVARVFVPATIGNVGPGFDVLGLAVDGLGDEVEVALIDGPSQIADVSGRDVDGIPRDPARNCAAIAALAMLKRIGDGRGVSIRLKRGLPVSGGLGSSAAASVGGAYAAALASGVKVDPVSVLTAALDGEAAVAGRHLDNIAPAFFGGLTVVLGIDPPQVAQVPIVGEWWATLVSPQARLSTKKARSVLPGLIEQSVFVRQLGSVAGLVTAFAKGDPDLVRLSLVDLYAEPLRAPLIKGFREVKAAALANGALGCSISGAGPTIFALSTDQVTAHKVGNAMVGAFQPMAATMHIGRVATQGARLL